MKHLGKIHGYQLIAKNRNSLGGGVALLIHNTLAVVETLKRAL